VPTLRGLIEAAGTKEVRRKPPIFSERTFGIKLAPGGNQTHDLALTRLVLTMLAYQFLTFIQLLLSLLFNLQISWLQRSAIGSQQT
jgi:hypothetical protein